MLNNRTPRLDEIRMVDPSRFFKVGMVFRYVKVRGKKILEFGYPEDLKFRKSDRIHYANI